MEKEIAYTGQTAAPSDYDCVDGTLAMSMNLWTENGSLKPVLQPKKLFNTGDPDRVVRCVHATSAFKHYIATEIQDDGLALSYFYLDKNDGEYKKVDFDSALRVEVNSIIPIGNTLVLLTDEGMMYYLWQDSEYRYLGDHLPELHLSFGLKGKTVVSDAFSITLPTAVNVLTAELSDNNSDEVTDRVLAAVNKFIAEESTNEGRFIMPFFVRYAYRLYDGSLTMHSAPVYMITSTDVTPQANFIYTTGQSSYKTINDVKVSAPVYDLTFKAVAQSEIDNISKNWRDIIKSVDIFISKPIYRYDQSGKCTRLKIGFIPGESFSYDEGEAAKQGSSSYSQRTISSMYSNVQTDNISSRPDKNYGAVVLPETGDPQKEVCNCSSFYILKSYDTSKLTTDIQTVEVAKDYLQSLVNRESMTDDYDSHDVIMAGRVFGYNSRLNLVNIKKRLFRGFSSPMMLNLYTGSGSTSTKMDFFVRLKQDGRDITVLAYERDVDVANNYPVLWFYYPNTNAYKLIVRTRNYERVGTAIKIIEKYYDFDLKVHDFLNGAYYFSGYPGRSGNQVIGYWYSNPKSEYDISESGLSDRTLNLPNKIYTSEVNNPFYFPVTGINTVGTGEILGISTTTKALSQGQFGQFPLYAFSTDGIWALEVSATGSYSTKQPVSRDVCINADSITQIDNAVLFVTERGIMLISGSEVICLSDMIDSKNDKPFSLLDYKGKNVLIGKDEMNIYALLKFESFLHGCQMLYDDTSRRIIVFNPTVRYAYIYSLNGKAWSMMPSNIRSAVKSYPEALALTYDGDLLDYSKRIPNDVVNNQVIMTRPFKLDMPDVLKTINTIIQRGNFKRGHVQQILYGSRNLINWTPIYSSVDHYLRGFSGTPYKYFQIALKCALSDDESLSGMSVIFTPKLVNQIR